jgi:peptide/nickel transport system substrate-binding protein
MEMEKKNLAIVILTIILLVSGTGNIILGIIGVSGKTPRAKNVLRAAGTDPYVIDPVDSWDSASNIIISHICENLWDYDLYDPNFPLEMELATNFTWNSGLDELTVILREDVYFHDGSYFNANAVQFTFDRILYFINASGTLDPASHPAAPASLFYDISGNSILNKTVVNSEYNITFILNRPYGVFVPLLSYEACAILHPATTPATTYLELGVDKLVGTGPFKYIRYKPGEELKAERWSLYWGPNTFWDEILWIIHPNPITANYAMLGKEIDFLGGCIPSLIPLFQADPEMVFVNLNTSTSYSYWGLNNKKINNTNIRKAIAYAYNYSYFIDVIMLGYVIRAHQFLPPGFPYYNESFRAPYYNTSIAREAMILAFPTETAGVTAQAYGVDAGNDAAWSALSLVSYKVVEIIDYPVSNLMATALIIDLDRIGITIIPDLMTLDEFYDVILNDIDRLNIWNAGWSPDYLDPFNMVEPLLNNMSAANEIQVQDAQIMQWLKEYEETDPVNTDQREILLWKIQQRAINVLHVELPLVCRKSYYVHHQSLGNVCYNILRKTWFRDTYFVPGVPRA